MNTWSERRDLLQRQGAEGRFTNFVQEWLSGTAEEDVHAELLAAYHMIEDLLGQLYGAAPGQPLPDAPGLELPPEQIRQLNTDFGRRVFAMGRQLAELKQQLAAATRFEHPVDLSGVEHRGLLDEDAWTVRIEQGRHGRWHIVRGDLRNPDADPQLAYFTDPGWTPAANIAHTDLIFHGYSTLSLARGMLDHAMQAQVAEARTRAEGLAALASETSRSPRS